MIAATMSLVPAPAHASRTTTSTTTYQVGSGDNDWKIAKKFGITTAELHRLNPNVKWNRLQIGTKIKVPGKAKSATKTAAKPAAKPAVKPVVNPRLGSAEVTRTDVIVRKGPGTNFDQVTKVTKGNKGAVLERRGGWTKIQFTGGTIGWIRDDMVKVTGVAKPAAKPVAQKPASKPATTVAKKPAAKPAELPATPDAKASVVRTLPLRVSITADNVIIRREPSRTSKQIVKVSKGRIADVIAGQGDWYKVKFGQGTTGWVHRDLVRPAGNDEREPRRTTVAKAPASAPKASGSAVALLDTAKDQLGVRYSWGGTSRGGFDCSGFVQYVFKKHGVNLPRTSIAQSGVGQRVAREDLQEGDLVFFITRGSRVSHVGIYIGGGKFIHASSGGGRVRIDALSSSYYNRRYAGARRVAKLNLKIVESAREEIGQKAVPEQTGGPSDLDGGSAPIQQGVDETGN